MNNHQKKIQADWEVRQQFIMSKGKSCNLETIINDVRRHSPLFNMVLAQYKNEVHPWVYYNYVVDWNAVPANKIPTQFDGDPLAFGRYVIDQWHTVCYKQKYYSSEEWTSVYTDYKELLAADNALLTEHGGNGITLMPPYTTDTDGNQTPAYRRHVELLWERKQEAIDREAERQQQELVRLEAERQQAIADGKNREADRLQAEANRQRADAEAKAFARQNRDFQTRANSPWSSSVTPQGEDVPTSTEPAPATVPDASSSDCTKVSTEPVSTSKSYRQVESFLVMADREARNYGMAANTTVARAFDGQYTITIYLRTGEKNDNGTDRIERFGHTAPSFEEAFPVAMEQFCLYINNVRKEREEAARAAQLRAQAEAKAAALRKELEDERRAEAERQKARDQKQRDLDELNALLSRLNH